MRQRKLPAKLLMVTALTFVSFIMVGQCFGVFGKAMPDDREGKRHDLLLHEIASYRQWTLVNPTPVLMDPASAQACAVFINQKFNPHSRKYVSVYVNRKGYSAMMTQLHPHFPEGSIIVKEKLSDKLSQTPELLTVMIKREEGYNPKSRNWEYLVLDGSASRVLEQAKSSTCDGCHNSYAKTDFVTRHYLPRTVSGSLR